MTLDPAHHRDPQDTPKATAHATENPRLSDLIDARLRQAADATLIDEGTRRTSVREFDALAGACAHWLRSQGIVAGDRVAIWMVNRVEWLGLMFGAARIGATIVSVNTRFRASELEYLLQRSGARLLVLQHDFRSIDFPSVLAECDPSRFPALERIALLDAGADWPTRLLDRPCVRVTIEDSQENPRAFATPDGSDPEAVTLLYTTSGTTRGPKLVMHTQRSLAWHARQVANAYGMTEPGSCLLGALPLCGTFGMTGVLAAIAGGAKVVMTEAFDGQQAARLVREHRVSHMFGSDEMYRRMLEAQPQRPPFPSARLFGYAAFQPRGEQFAIECNELGLPLFGLYGSSEVQALFSVQSAALPLAERVRGGGTPASPSAQVRIRDLASGDLAAPGVSGEIEIASRGNFAGYLNDAQASADAIGADGFFRTGDIGHLRADGSFVFETRRGDAIRLGGFLVNPAEIEDVLKTLPGVADVAVIGIEIAAQSRCVAFVVRTPGSTLDAASLTESARQLMANFKTPARFWFVDTLPTTASANGTKVQRARMREMAAERLAAEPTATAN